MPPKTSRIPLTKLIPWLIFVSVALLSISIPAQNLTEDSIPSSSKKNKPAEDSDSLLISQDSSNVYYFRSNFEAAGEPPLSPIDTTLDNFNLYDPMRKHHFFSASLGNIGQNYRSLLPFQNLGKPLGIDYGIHTFDNYLLSTDSVRYYKIYKTFSELKYVQGAKKEQNFTAEFSRDIYQGLNLGFNFRVASAPGAYQRQKTNHINLIVNGQYFTRNKRYGVIASFVFNRLKNYENGGLKYDSLFSQNLETNRLVIPVNLQNAQNRVRESGFFMKHYFDLKRSETDPDDSSAIYRKALDFGRLSYSFKFNRQIQNFTDNAADSSFYPPPILDTINTLDSLTFRQFQNIITWSNPSHKRGMAPRVIHLTAGIRQSYTEISLHDSKQTFTQYIPFAGIDFTPFQSATLSGQAEYVIGDYNEQDFLISATLLTILGKREKNLGTTRINLTIRSEQPGYFFSQYKGNFNQWNNSWNKTGIISTSFTYQYKFLESGVSLNRVQNFVYLDTLLLPQQSSKEFAYLQVYAKTNVDLWKFRIISHLVYHTVQGTNILNLPVFMGNLSLNFVQPLFKGAAILQPGLNFFYNTKYYADLYHPALRSFYLQNKTQTGNYLYMDIFINLKVQRARFFVSYTHMNAGWTGYHYYSTPGYPDPDGAFKFGISWRFHD